MNPGDPGGTEARTGDGVGEGGHLRIPETSLQTRGPSEGSTVRPSPREETQVSGTFRGRDVVSVTPSTNA